MTSSRSVAPPGARALLAALALAGCGVGEISPGAGSDDTDETHGTDGSDPTDGSDQTDGGDVAGTDDGTEGDAPEDQPANPCALGAPGVYTPFAESGAYPSGPVSELPWAGVASAEDAVAYPAGDEDFSGYGAELPTVVECSDEKQRRSHLDVTSGCLDAVAIDGATYTRGLIRADGDDYFRALALGYTPADAGHPIKWTDQGIAYRFLHHGQSGDASNPGFKAFARYRSEDDLYVAAWRFDGVVQILAKLCGEYTALAENNEFGPPTPDVFHSIRFEAVGDSLELYLDDALALSATSGSLSWGTAGIRIDSADGAYIDDWSVYQP